jgi:hypothetical protein
LPKDSGTTAVSSAEIVLLVAKPNTSLTDLEMLAALDFKVDSDCLVLDLGCRATRPPDLCPRHWNHQKLMQTKTNASQACAVQTKEVKKQ